MSRCRPVFNDLWQLWLRLSATGGHAQRSEGKPGSGSVYDLAIMHQLTSLAPRLMTAIAQQVWLCHFTADKDVVEGLAQPRSAGDTARIAATG